MGACALSFWGTKGAHNPLCFSSLFPASSFAGPYLILESPFPSPCLLPSSTLQDLSLPGLSASRLAELQQAVLPLHSSSGPPSSLVLAAWKNIWRRAFSPLQNRGFKLEGGYKCLLSARARIATFQNFQACISVSQVEVTVTRQACPIQAFHIRTVSFLSPATWLEKSTRLYTQK